MLSRLAKLTRVVEAGLLSSMRCSRAVVAFMRASQMGQTKERIQGALEALASELDGELHVDLAVRKLYSTDASVYQELPLAVAIPRSEADVQKLVLLAREHGTNLIPRTAGTSLSGQVVGNGIVVDVSRHFTRILEINESERWVRVQPGVIRNELNRELAKHGLLFGPETSTQNRAMIGGMVGNNSCGSNSIVYGSTRDHTLELRGFLSDGTEAHFGQLSDEQFAEKCNGESFEAEIYRKTRDLLGGSGRACGDHSRIPQARDPAPEYGIRSRSVDGRQSADA